MNTIEELKAAIQGLEKNVKKDLEEVRQHKREIQQLEESIRMNSSATKYVRDDNCLILSAPNIIIGNVDKSGRLYSGGSRLILRGNEIDSEATGPVGSGGIIRNRATSIENIAVDPGTDGLENAVFPGSRIVNQARSVTLQANDEKGTFSTSPVAADGINIVSDTTVNVAALAQNKNRKADIDGQVKNYTNASASYAKMAAKYKKSLDDVLKQMSDIVSKQGRNNGSSMLLAANFEEHYGQQHEMFRELEQVLYTFVSNYVTCLSMQAEAERSITALKATKKELDSATGNFDKSATLSHISLNSETVSINSTDGDGSIRENSAAGLFVSVPHLDVSSFDKKGKLIKDSSIALRTEQFDLSTANPAYDDEKYQKGQFPATGSVTVTSKEVTVQAVDTELKDKKVTEKALTAGGKFSVRAENVALLSTDTEGKSTGKLTLNAKTMNIAAMDVDKEKRTDKEMAAGSKLTVLAEKTLIGTTKKSKLIQLASEKLALIGKDTAELQQDGKAVVTASGGSVTAGGSKVELQGNTTIGGNAEIKGETKSPKVTADQVQASAAFKSPNINDTMGVGIAAPAGRPSAKMKEEEAKTTA